MERINLDRYAKEPTPVEKRGETTTDQEVFAEELQQVLNRVKPGQTVHWYSDGDWSMWQLLNGVLKKILKDHGYLSPAEVHISSYAFSETSARMIANLKSKGHISQLYCVLDNRTDTRSAGSLQLLKSISDKLALISTHAKVTLIRTTGLCITITGSANYTENVRYEAGTITCNPQVYAFHKQWIEKELYATHT